MSDKTRLALVIGVLIGAILGLGFGAGIKECPEPTSSIYQQDKDDELRLR